MLQYRIAWLEANHAKLKKERNMNYCTIGVDIGTRVENHVAWRPAEPNDQFFMAGEYLLLIAIRPLCFGDDNTHKMRWSSGVGWMPTPAYVDDAGPYVHSGHLTVALK